MKKGFTLVELLIVVVVLVTLMTVTFRLSSIGTSSQQRTETVSKLQKLENCLSGYYAAYGTYPPVRLHGSRNYLLDVSSHGIQGTTESDLNLSWFNASTHAVTDSSKEAEDWEKVQAACKAQPVACRYPYPSDSSWQSLAQTVSQMIERRAQSATNLSDERKKALTSGFTVDIAGSLGAYNSKTEWNDVQAFQFGLLSFLLPRYLIMMEGDSTLFTDMKQWTDNNTLPCDPMTGQRFGSWSDVRNYALSDDAKDVARVTSIPSQAVCARWLPNLAGICQFGRSYSVFGVSIGDGESTTASGMPTTLNGVELFSPGGYDQTSTSGQYILDGVNVVDGWDNPFYYYSPPPYQTYVLWSAGPNGRTFPPWVAREKLDSSANACIGYWVEDDITSMSN